MKIFLKASFLSFLLVLGSVFASFFSPPASAQSAGCVITKVGSPKGPSPTFPPECLTTIDITNLQCKKVSNGEYCKLPPSPMYSNGTPYYVTERWTRWGSKEMIQMLLTVAQKWKTLHPKGFLVVNDIAAPRCDRGCHKEHYGGTAVDIIATTNGIDRVSDNIGDSWRWRDVRTGVPGIYNATATVEFGKLFRDTGLVNYIIYYDTRSNSISQLKALGLKMLSSSIYSDHKNHFHVFLKRPLLNPACSVAISSNCR